MANELNLEGLRARFTPQEIEWRVQRCGKTKQGKIWASLVPYITNRAIQDRLDSVVGPENWQNRFAPISLPNAVGFVCEIGIKCGDEWVWKGDTAPTTDIESIKGGASGAMKRAAVEWGMGRYLYESGEFWADNIKDGRGPKEWNVLRIYSKKEGIDAWCYSPTLPGDTAPTNQQPPAETASGIPRDKVIAKIRVMERDVYPHSAAIANAHAKYLFNDLANLTDDVLVKYGKHLAEKQKAEEEKAEKKGKGADDKA